MYFCIKINMKLVWFFFFFLLYQFLRLLDLQLAGLSVCMGAVRLAHLAWVTLKSHREERKKNFKPSICLILCKIQQLLFIQVVLVLILNLPFAYLALRRIGRITKKGFFCASGLMTLHIKILLLLKIARITFWHSLELENWRLQ